MSFLRLAHTHIHSLSLALANLSRYAHAHTAQMGRCHLVRTYMRTHRSNVLQHFSHIQMISLFHNAGASVVVVEEDAEVETEDVDETEVVDAHFVARDAMQKLSRFLFVSDVVVVMRR